MKATIRSLMHDCISTGKPGKYHTRDLNDSIEEFVAVMMSQDEPFTTFNTDISAYETLVVARTTTMEVSIIFVTDMK